VPPAHFLGNEAADPLLLLGGGLHTLERGWPALAKLGMTDITCKRYIFFREERLFLAIQIFGDSEVCTPFLYILSNVVRFFLCSHHMVRLSVSKQALQSCARLGEVDPCSRDLLYSTMILLEHPV